jgi:hypothetical protein
LDEVVVLAQRWLTNLGQGSKQAWLSPLKERKPMARFTKGARVRFAEAKTTGRVGTVLEILPRPERGEEFDRYQVEFSDGEIKTLSDMELSPAGTGSATLEDAP